MQRRVTSTWARANVAPPPSFRMPTRLTIAAAPCASRSSTAGFGDVGLDHLDGGQQEEVPRVVAPAGGDDDACAVGDEPGDDVPADEAAAADDQDPALRHGADSLAQGDSARAPPFGAAPRGATVPRRTVSAR